MPRTRLKLGNFLPYRLSFTSNLVSTMIASRYVAPFGVSIPEWRVIAVIAEHGRISQQAICQLTRMDKVTVSRAAIALVDRKLIARTRNPDDKRSQLLALAAAGRQLYESIAPRAMEMEAQIFSCLSAQDRLMLMRLLGSIDAHVDLLASRHAYTTETPETLRCRPPPA